MIPAKVAPDGSLYGLGESAGATVHVKRHLALGEMAMPCGRDCLDGHPYGARCVVPHATLIRKRERERAADTAIEAEKRAQAIAALQAKGVLGPDGLPV